MLLTFDFKTVEEAQEFLAGLLVKPQQFCSSDDPVKGCYGPPANGSELEEDCGGSPVVPPEKKKPGRPKKAAKPETVYGLEDCRNALSNLFDIKGRDAAKAALAEFKVARIGELKADQYRSFIVLCETRGQPE